MGIQICKLHSLKFCLVQFCFAFFFFFAECTVYSTSVHYYSLTPGITDSMNKFQLAFPIACLNENHHVPEGLGPCKQEESVWTGEWRIWLGNLCFGLLVSLKNWFKQIVFNMNSIRETVFLLEELKFFFLLAFFLLPHHFRGN